MYNIYAIHITGNKKDLDILDEAVYNMANTRDIAKKNNKGFKFMSKDWLPLIVFDRIIKWREKGVYNQELEGVYNTALGAEVAHKIYFADLERDGCNMIIYYKSKSAFRDFIISLFRGYNVTITDIERM